MTSNTSLANLWTLTQETPQGGSLKDGYNGVQNDWNSPQITRTSCHSKEKLNAAFCGCVSRNPCSRRIARALMQLVLIQSCDLNSFRYIPLSLQLAVFLAWTSQRGRTTAINCKSFAVNYFSEEIVDYEDSNVLRKIHSNLQGVRAAPDWRLDVHIKVKRNSVSDARFHRVYYREKIVPGTKFFKVYF